MFVVVSNYAKVFDAAHYEIHKGYTRAQVIQAFRLDNPDSVNKSDDQLVSQIAAADPELMTNITEPAAEEKALPIPDLGEAYFPRDVPPDVAAKVIANFTNRSRASAGIGQNQDERVGNSWRFTILKKFDGLRAIGLGALVMAVSALVIQSVISVVAWIIRGFKVP